MTLAQVNTALETILTGGQTFTDDGVTYTQASLGALQALRTEMMAQTARTTRPLFRAFRASSMGYEAATATDPATVTPVPL